MKKLIYLFLVLTSIFIIYYLYELDILHAIYLLIIASYVHLGLILGSIKEDQNYKDDQVRYLIFKLEQEIDAEKNNIKDLRYTLNEFLCR